MRTRYCGSLKLDDLGYRVTLAGWLHKKRILGKIIFFYIRDHFGITQCVIAENHSNFEMIKDLSLESVIQVQGIVSECRNTKNQDNFFDLQVQSISVLSRSRALPFSVNSEDEVSETLRLQYRFLDLRRKKMHENIILRSEFIFSLRKAMFDAKFLEFQTPILTSYSTEGAREFFVPSRIHKGEYYALSQAPQQYKELLLIAGYDRYFQVAPCFRDESGRADRVTGEFYQLDLEMAFVNQDDILSTIESVLYQVFKEFARGKKILCPFPRIPYNDALLQYGSENPDLSNPLVILDLSFYLNHFKELIPEIISTNDNIIRGIIISISDDAQIEGLLHKVRKECSEEIRKKITYCYVVNNRIIHPNTGKEYTIDPSKVLLNNAPEKQIILLVAGEEAMISQYMHIIRGIVATELDLLEKDVFKFCWVVDFPMYKFDKISNKLQFMANPLSMPQGGLDGLDNTDPLSILTYHYNLVCNGMHITNGSVRNHISEILFKVFSIVGYNEENVRTRFGRLINALQFGVPPHGGAAPSIDRMTMLLCDEKNIRNVIAFPKNQKVRDLMMDAPCKIPSKLLEELY